jgi:HSP20 family protein
MLYIDAELPGFTREQVDITVDADVLTIAAERPQPQTADESVTWHLRERRSGRVERAFKLPNTVDYGSVDAKLADGILRVSLRKRQEAKPRKIEIA